VKILSKKFFERPAPEVAEDLLGKYLVRKTGNKTTALMITEVEAYDGIDDLASHASKEKTKRNSVMWGEAGVFYVYFVYGMYYMLNVVTGKKNHPSAVLIRGVEGMKGPGVLTRNLKINKNFNEKKAEPKTGLWFENNPTSPQQTRLRETKEILKTPRIGVAYAGPVWSKKMWRFVYSNVKA
jgi:DNA-3-methyladenine glycosylase